jgi:transposase
MGHQVRLVSPRFVKPYVKSNKNDLADAEAICEAASRPTMRFVDVKTIEQQDIQALHRVRERLVRQRTALCNEIRGLLLEFGIVLRQGRRWLVSNLVQVLESHRDALSPMMLELMDRLRNELKQLCGEIEVYDRKLKALGETHPVCRQLTTVPGIGPVTATALVALVSNMHAFKNGRNFAASLGLVPGQSSSGNRQRLLGISKRGDRYVRKLLVHGARSALRQVAKKDDRRSLWSQRLLRDRGMNRTAVAFANKNARVIWAMLTKQEPYREFRPEAALAA